MEMKASASLDLLLLIRQLTCQWSPLFEPVQQQ
jgi:hypothetical protein